MVASGARFLFGVVLKPVSEAHGWDRATMSGAVLMGMIFLSACQPLAGVLTDRFGPKKVVLAGVLLLGLALFPLSVADSLWQIYLFWGVFTSIGLAATSPVNATAFVSRWFEKKRGVAMSLATSGAAFGQLLIVPVAAWILTLTDWHTTYRVLAATLLLVMFPLGALLLKDGPTGSVAPSKSLDATGFTVREALSGPLFWLLAFGFIVCGWTMAFPQVHFIAYADDMGMNLLHASNVISVTAIFSIGGTMLAGWMADRHRRSSVLAVVYALRALAFALLLVLPVGNLIFVYAVVLGVSWSATTPLTAAIAADRYGKRHLGTIFGTMFTFMNIGFGVGSFVDGVLYEWSGDYRMSLLVNVAMGVLATVAVLLVDRAQTSSIGPALPAAAPAPAGD